MRGRGTAAARQLQLARGLVTLAVALGLVGMHGLGQSAVLGCHGQVDPDHAQHSVLHSSHAKTLDADPHWDSDKHAALSGDVCKPLLPSWLGWLPLLTCVALLSLAALLTLGASLRGSRAHLREWWRAPPRAGRVCLLRVCVSRT